MKKLRNPIDFYARQNFGNDVGNKIGLIYYFICLEYEKGKVSFLANVYDIKFVISFLVQTQLRLPLPNSLSFRYLNDMT